MTILVAYKLVSDRDYTAFFEALRAEPVSTWWHYIDNVWLLKTDETLEQLQARLDPYIDIGKDILILTKVDLSDYAGWLPREAHEWILAHEDD